MPVAVEKDDFVLLRTDSKKPILVRVTRAKPGSYKGVVSGRDEASADTVKYVEFNTSDVLANVGTSPHYGTVYNTKVEVFRGSSTIGKHHVLYYRSLGQDEKVRLEKKIKLLFKQMRDDGLHFDKEVDITIRENSGRMVGHYKHFNKDEKTDELCLKPGKFGQREDSYLICHEAAHGLWFTRMSPDLQAKWVRAYSRNVTMSKIKSEQLEELRSELVDAAKVSDLHKNLDDEMKLVLRECLRYVKRVHSLVPRHINALLEVGDTLEDYWPKSRVDIQHKQIMVSEYAMTSPDEFWAEAFGFHRSGYQVIPKSIIPLMEKTLATLKAGSGTAKDLDDDTQVDD